MGDVAFYRFRSKAGRGYPIRAPHRQELKEVLLVNTLLDRGGAARAVTQMLGTGLRKYDVQVHYLANETYPNLKDGSVLCAKEIPGYSLSSGMVARWLGLQDFLLPTEKIAEFEEFQSADVLHLHNLHSNDFAFFNPLALKKLCAWKPTVWTIHDQHLFTGHCAMYVECERWQVGNGGCVTCPHPGYYPAIRRDTCQQVLKLKAEIYRDIPFTIVAVCRWQKKQIEQSIIADRDVRVIHNGIDPNVFAPVDKEKARDALGLPKDKKIVLFFADGPDVNHVKGQRYVEEIAKRLDAVDDVLFLVIGGRRESKVGPIWEVPYVYDLRLLVLYLGAADIFLYPTLADNCPFVVIESLAMELPVVSFETGGVPEIVTHLESGYLAKYKDTDDLLHGTRMLLDDTDLRARMGRQGRAKVLNEFTEEYAVQQYYQLYQELLSKRCTQ